MRLKPIPAAIQLALIGFVSSSFAQDSSKIEALPEVQVHDKKVQENATSPLQGYVATKSSTGTKTEAPIIENPQSITVVGEEQIRNQGANNIAGSLAYAAGVTFEEAGSITDDFVLRGFPANGYHRSLYLDGSKYSTNRYAGQMETYGLERVELLRGPSSVMYGLGAPGGVINAVSKRPTEIPFSELNVSMGNFDRKQISGDSSGNLSKDGELKYRITGLYRNGNAFTDFTPDDRTYISPVLEWKPSNETSLTVMARHQSTRTRFIFGHPAEGTIKPNKNGKISRNRFWGTAGIFDPFKIENNSLSILFKNKISEGAYFHQTLRSENHKSRYNYAENEGWADEDQRLLSRSLVEREDPRRKFFLDSRINISKTSDELSHDIAIGFDFDRSRSSLEQYISDLSPIDLFTPDYSNPVISNREFSPYSDKTKSDSYGVYAQDQIKLKDLWVISLSGRQDWHHAKTADYEETNWENHKDRAFTGRFGLAYLSKNGLVPFLSFSQSFQPTEGKDRLGVRFKPTRGIQWETGFRYQAGNDAYVTASVYEIAQNNVLTADPVDPEEYQIQVGQIKSRGFELEAKARLNRKLWIIASYAFTDAKTRKSTDPSEVGKKSAGVPKHQGSIWADYSFTNHLVSGLKIGSGIRYVGERKAEEWFAENTMVPSYTVIDAMLSYTTGPWVLSLNVNNLTDKTYFSSCTYGCFYGEPRKVFGTVSYKW